MDVVLRTQEQLVGDPDALLVGGALGVRAGDALIVVIDGGVLPGEELVLVDRLVERAVAEQPFVAQRDHELVARGAAELIGVIAEIVAVPRRLRDALVELERREEVDMIERVREADLVSLE